MPTIIDGKTTAKNLREDVRRQTEQLKAQGVVPGA